MEDRRPPSPTQVLWNACGREEFGMNVEDSPVLYLESCTAAKP